MKGSEPVLFLGGMISVSGRQVLLAARVRAAAYLYGA